MQRNARKQRAECTFGGVENYQLSRCSFSHLNCVIVPHLLRGIGQYLSIAFENEIQTNKMQF